MTTPVLEYSGKKRGHLRRFWWRYAIVVAIAAGAPYAYRESQQLFLRIQILQWQKQCLEYNAPSGVVLGTGDPSEIARLQASSKDYHLENTGFGNRQYLSFRPYCWKQLDRLLTQLPGRAGWPYIYINDMEPILFMHEMKSPAGNRRLILIQCQSQNALTLDRHMMPVIMQPGTLFSAPRIISGMGDVFISERSIPVRISYGTSDPTNPSHVSFVYSNKGIKWFDGQEYPKKIDGIIDGYLNDDDTMTFKIRNPASTQGL